MNQNSLASLSNKPAIKPSDPIIPKIELIGDDTIVITGNTPEELSPHLGNILGIVHAIRHFSQDGDRSGRRAIAEKKATGIPLENNEFRLCFSYTNSRTVRSDGSIIINFLISNADAREHRLLLSDDSSGNQPYRIMSGDETKQYFAKLVSMCLSELREYLDRAFSFAPNGNSSPSHLIQ